MKRRAPEAVSRRTRSRSSSTPTAPPPTAHADFSETDDQESVSSSPPLASAPPCPPIRFSKYEIQPFFASPLPERYQSAPVLFFCQFCLEYTKTQAAFACHCAGCAFRRPPGKQVYRSPTLSVFKVDGVHDQLYCERLTVLAKLFLQDKSIGAHVSLFTFYVLCEVSGDPSEHTLVGYFSKEKKSPNTLGCILTLPPHQRTGYGGFLISLSYALARRDGRAGSPEGPLSALGQRSFLSYWASELVPLLAKQVQHRQKRQRVRDLVKQTSIDANDIAYVFEELGLLVEEDGEEEEVVVLDRDKLERLARELRDKHKLKPPLRVEAKYLMLD